MSTTKTSSTQFDSQSMANYHSAQNTLLNTYQGMVQNPYSGPSYQMGLQQNMNAANQLSAGLNRNAMQNWNTSMGSLTGGARASLLSGLGRQSAGIRQQGFFNNWNTATANQQFGANVLGQMQPLVTGNKQTTSGLGTWLPQLAGAAIGAATGFATGGASGAMSGASQGSNALGSAGMDASNGLYGPGFGAWNNVPSMAPSLGAYGNQNSFMMAGGFNTPGPSYPRF